MAYNKPAPPRARCMMRAARACRAAASAAAHLNVEGHRLCSVSKLAHGVP